MKEKCAENNDGKITEDPDRIWKSAGQIRDDDLGHRVVRTNIEHVNVMRPPDRKIDDCSSTAKDRKQDDGGGKSMPRMIADVRKAAEEPDGNQSQMPQIGMNGKRQKWIVHSACVQENRNSAQKRKIHQKGIEDPTDMGSMKERQKKQQVHRNRTKLKRKIPPVISPVSENESQRPLLPDFTCRHHKPCIKKKAFRTVQRPEISHTTSLLAFFVLIPAENSIRVFYHIIQKEEQTKKRLTEKRL